jgi:hypothetical protein
MPYRALLASVLLLAACTTTQGVTDRLGERYTGRHIDQLFVSYGPPVSEYALSNGVTAPVSLENDIPTGLPTF